MEAGVCEVCGSSTPEPGRLLCDQCLAHLEYHMETGASEGRQGPLLGRTPAELEELAQADPDWGAEP